MSASSFATKPVDKYDGQSISIGGRVIYELGHYLGNGASGSVYQASQLQEQSNERPVAVKVLNPIGFKLASHAQIQKGTVLLRGHGPSMDQQKGKLPLTRANVWWLLLGQPSAVSSGSSSGRLVVAAYEDAARGQLREMSLPKCVEVWGWQPLQGGDSGNNTNCADANGSINISDSDGDNARTPSHSAWSGISAAEEDRLNCAGTVTVPVSGSGGGVSVRLPLVSPKFVKWLRTRAAVCREIAHMRQVGPHPNVVRLHEVLELLQDSKATLFLVLELVLGGELIERMRHISGADGARARERFQRQQHVRRKQRVLVEAADGGGDGVGGEKSVGAGKDDEQPLLVPQEWSEDGEGGGKCFGWATEQFARKYFVQLLSGIAFTHARGVCHRDLKPENLLLSESSDDAVLKIADFGLSAAFATGGPQHFQQEDDGVLPVMPSPLALTRMRSVVGSPHYVAPEVVMTPPTPSSAVSTSPHSPPPSPGTGMGTGTGMEGRSLRTPRRRSTGGASTSPAPGPVPSPSGGQGAVGYDGRAVDMWSAGVVLYSLLFGALPFGSELASCPRFARFAGEQSQCQEAARGNFFPSWFFPCHHDTTASADMLHSGGQALVPAISRPACELILLLLRLEPSQRLSAEGALSFVRQHWAEQQESCSPTAAVEAGAEYKADGEVGAEVGLGGMSLTGGVHDGASSGGGDSIAGLAPVNLAESLVLAEDSVCYTDVGGETDDEVEAEGVEESKAACGHIGGADCGGLGCGCGVEGEGPGAEHENGRPRGPSSSSIDSFYCDGLEVERELA